MLHSNIYRLLNRLKASIRLYLFLEIAAQSLAAVAIFCWASLGLDYWLEMQLWVRGAILALAGTGLLVGLLVALFGRLLVGLPLSRLALAIESLVPELGDRLITALELERYLQAADPTFSHSLARNAIDSAAEAVKGIRTRELMDFRRLRKRLAVTLVLVLSWAIFSLAATGPAEIWFQRNVLLDASTEWPHRTSLRVLGFTDGKALIARGGEFAVRTAVEGEVPSKMQIRYRMQTSRAKGRAYLLKVGESQFVHRFTGLLEPVRFYVRGGDDYEGPFLIETVPPPAVHDLRIACRYPEYTGLEPNTLTNNALVYTLPYGTRLDFSGTANKDLQQVHYVAGQENRAFAPQRPRGFSFGFYLLETVSLRLSLRDRHGIENREARSMTIVARPDHPPTIDAALHGIRQSITAKAVIPFRGTLKDEYGILKAEFRFRIDSGEEQALPFSRSPAGARELSLREQFAVAPRQLEPGKKLQLQILAEDGNTLSGPKVGKSRVYSFAIVSPDELLSQIAARELNLRRRFERALTEVKEARDDLVHVGQEQAKPDADRSMLKLHAERVLLGSRKNLNEVAGISQAFHDILLELRNNGITIDTLLERIEQGICIPLTDLTTNRFPDLADAVQKLSASLGQNDNLAASAEGAERSATILIEKMEKVLAAMLNLESFNEALEILRSIISLQKQVENDTKDLRKKRIQELLK